jgi:CRP-like cAMP-binding protein
MRLADLLSPGARAREAELAHALRSVPLFRELPAGDLLGVWRAIEEERVSAGAVICRRGEPGERFFVLQRGSLEVRLGLGPSGVVVRRLVPGDAFGEMALVTGAPRSADVVAAEDSVLWALRRVHFESLTARSVPLLRALNRDLCERIAQLTLQIEHLEATHGASAGVAGLRFGSYRVVEQIGAGGMSVVYSAVHAETEQAAAVKVLPLSWGDAGELRERLRREAALLGRLCHPNIVRVLEVDAVGQREGGGCYIAMEWVPHALDRVLRAQFPEPLAAPTALAIAEAVADALAAVHRLGIVHRDVKPGNVLLRADGTPALTDFGLALARDAAREQRLTTEDVVVGTADYMSPEQVAGLPLDGRSDLYSLGAVLYELLAGHVPFAGLDPYRTLTAHVEEPPPPLPSSVPAAVRAVVERALAKSPDARFPSARAMAEALNAAREGLSTSVAA